MRHTEKSRTDFSVCLIGIFSCGADFSENGGDFLKNGAAVLKNLVDFFEKLAFLFWPVAPVAFSVALPRVQFAPVNITMPDS